MNNDILKAIISSGTLIITSIVIKPVQERLFYAFRLEKEYQYE